MMRGASPPPGRSDSFARIVANLAVVLLALGAVGYFGVRRPDPKPRDQTTS